MFVFIMLVGITLISCFVHFLISFSLFKKHNKKGTKYITTIAMWLCCSLFVAYNIYIPFSATVLFNICAMGSVFVGTILSFCMFAIVEINIREQQEQEKQKEVQTETKIEMEV